MVEGRLDPDELFNSLNQPCTYYQLDDMDNLDNADCNSLGVIHINIRSLHKNLDEFMLKLDIIKCKFDVIILSETWFETHDESFQLQGFNAFHSIRHDRKGGGVTALVRNHLAAYSISDLTCSDSVFESIGICITMSKNIYIVGTYRPPSCSLAEFNYNYFHMIKNSESHNETCILIGDFNVDTIEESLDSELSSFVDNLQSEFFIPLINIPTRITSSTASCIDHIYTNCTLPIVSGVFDALVSDHCAIFCIIPIPNSNLNELKMIKFREHSDHNVNRMCESIERNLANFNAYNSFGIDDRVRIFQNIVYKCYDQTCKIKTKYISLKRLSSPWLTDALISCIKKKHRLYKLSFHGIYEMNAYKNYRNTLQKIILNAKRNYYLNKFESSKYDPKSSWKLINNLLKPGKKNNEWKIKNENNTITNKQIISDLFNNYVAKVPVELASKIPTVQQNPLSFINPCVNSFVYFDATSVEIENTINAFKSKSSSLYEVPSMIYKRISRLVSPIIADLINCSVLQGQFPDSLKTARVTPIHKTGSKTLHTNYRPISSLPFLSKIFEKVMHKRIVNFATKFHFFFLINLAFSPKSVLLMLSLSLPTNVIRI